MEINKEENKRLCDTYPFLIPFNRWTDELFTEIDPEYDYEFTELDDMPDGWRNAFGEKMCQEIKYALLRVGGEKALKEYRVDQIKEKYGELRWYSNHYIDRVEDIVEKYSETSRRICIKCGKPATKISTGWISPFCDECANELKHVHFQDINEYESEPDFI